ELGIVSRKDRASGQGAMGFSETVEELDREMENDRVNDFDPFNLRLMVQLGG
ncbi:hypothetical protein TorRG33x02_043340, partial [Trema orientale]